MILNLPAYVVKACLLCASTDATRHYLQGMHIVPAADKPGVLRVESTDGHILYRYDMPMPEGYTYEEGFIIPSQFLENVFKINKSQTLEIDLDLQFPATGYATGTISVCGLTSPLIDGQFPNTVRVVPEGYEVAEAGIALKAETLGILMKIAQLSNKKFGGIRFIDSCTDKPMRVKFKGQPDSLAVIMPLFGAAANF